MSDADTSTSWYGCYMVHGIATTISVWLLRRTTATYLQNWLHFLFLWTVHTPSLACATCQGFYNLILTPQHGRVGGGKWTPVGILNFTKQKRCVKSIVMTKGLSNEIITFSLYRCDVTIWSVGDIPSCTVGFLDTCMKQMVTIFRSWMSLEFHIGARHHEHLSHLPRNRSLDIVFCNTELGINS